MVLGQGWCLDDIRAERDFPGEKAVTRDHKTYIGAKFGTNDLSPGLFLSRGPVFSGVFIKRDVSVRHAGHFRHWG